MNPSIAASVIEVIQVHYAAGQGVEGDPCRRITDYYAPDGKFLARRDEWVERGGRAAVAQGTPKEGP